MSFLSIKERPVFEELFDMSGGHVLDFTNAKFQEFLDDHGVDIHGRKHRDPGR